MNTQQQSAPILVSDTQVFSPTVNYFKSKIESEIKKLRKINQESDQ